LFYLKDIANQHCIKFKSSRDIANLQLAYLELSKIVFLPYLYDYSPQIAENSKILAKIIDDLKKVKKRQITAPNDCANIVSAIMELSGTMKNFDVTNSKYIQTKVDEYVKLYLAKTTAMIQRKNRVVDQLENFKNKNSKINSDDSMKNYLKIFVTLVKRSYGLAEMIVNGSFKMKEFGVNSINVESEQDLFSIVPIISGGLKTISKSDGVHLLYDRVINMIE